MRCKLSLKRAVQEFQKRQIQYKNFIVLNLNNQAAKEEPTL